MTEDALREVDILLESELKEDGGIWMLVLGAVNDDGSIRLAEGHGKFTSRMVDDLIAMLAYALAGTAIRQLWNETLLQAALEQLCDRVKLEFTENRDDFYDAEGGD